MKVYKMTPEQAQTIALQALAFLAKNEERLGAFLAHTGMGPKDLKKQMNDPAVLGGVLDTILSDDRILLDFCSDADLSPTSLMTARSHLPGGLEIYN